MSRGNHPHIDLDRVGASQSFKLLLLYRAQQFRLQFQGDVSNSSRKSVPPSASSNLPFFCIRAPVNAPLSCPKSSVCRRPAGIAAQLTFTRLRYYEAEFVNRLRDEFLPGSSLAGD